MKIKKIQDKTIKELNNELSVLLHEQFNLKMKFSSGQLKHLHLLKQKRRNIARIKTFLTKKATNRNEE